MTRWRLRYGLGIDVIPSQELGMLQYKFCNRSGEFIDMKEDKDDI
jgi:ribonuclease G